MTTVIVQQLSATWTYDTLQQKIASWLHRKDLASQIPDFIMLAELEINRRLKVRPMEIEARFPMTIASRYVELPDDYSTPIALWDETYQRRRELTALLPENLPVTNTPGRPDYWAIDNGAIAFDIPADQAYPLTFRYMQKFALSDDNPTNTLLSTAPDVYLYGALLEAQPYLVNDARIPTWQAKYERVIKSINDNSNKSRAIAPLQTEILGSVGSGARFNIFRGY